MKGNLIIFDIGGVLAKNTNVVPYICKKLDITKSDFIKYADVEKLKEIQTGKISMDEFWNHFEKKSGINVNEDLFESFFNPVIDTKTLEVIKKLKKKYRVIAGTNTITPHYDIHKKRGDYDLFDKVYASHLIGFSKPDSDFYEKILEIENSSAEEAVFIDDTRENVEEAEKLHIKSYLFRTPEELESDLESDFIL